MNAVHIDGVAVLPGIDYSIGTNKISFSVPPDNRSEIIVTEVIDAKRGATHMTRLIGDGKTYVFALDRSFVKNLELQTLLDQVWIYKDVPAVADALEKLQVIVNLITEDDTLYKRR